MTDILTKDKDIENYWWPKGQTGRLPENGLLDYERNLGFSRQNLTGKKVLDLGSGGTERFTRELEEADIDANVVSLSPDFGTRTQSRTGSVAGIAQRLPFKDQTFDIILGLESVAYGALTDKDIEAWVSEIGRTLKSGGEARIGPVLDYGRGQTTSHIKNISKKIGISLAVVTEESGNRYYLLNKP